MSILKRILLFLGCFIVISVGIYFIGSALAGVVAYRGVPDPAVAAQLGRAAGMAFGVRYGEVINGVALIFAAGIAFRWWGAAIAIAICAGMIFLSGGFNALSGSNTVAQTALTGTPRVRLAEAVTVKLPYGKVSLPAGTPVEVLGETGDSVQLRLHTGQQITVPKSKVK